MDACDLARRLPFVGIFASGQITVPVPTQALTDATALPRQQLAEAELIVTANIAARADPPARLAVAHPRRRTPDHAPVSVTRHRRVGRGPTAPCRVPHCRRHGHSSIEQQSFNEDRLHPVRRIDVFEGDVSRQLLLRPLALFRGRGSGSTHAWVVKGRSVGPGCQGCSSIRLVDLLGLRLVVVPTLDLAAQTARAWRADGHSEHIVIVSSMDTAGHGCGVGAASAAGSTRTNCASRRKQNLSQSRSSPTKPLDRRSEGGLPLQQAVSGVHSGAGAVRSRWFSRWGCSGRPSG